MHNNTENTCRFCLKLEHSANVVELNEVMQEMLSLLLIKLDLDVSHHPMICTICSEALDEVYLFKSKCLHTEDIIRACIDANLKVSLRDILIEIENKRNVKIGEDEVVCRLCLEIPPSGSYITLGETSKEISISSDTINTYLPEMDLCIIEKPVICEACHVQLKNYISFATNCMAVERKIKLYCDLHKISEPVNLSCVSHFMEDKALDLQNRPSTDLVIKQEEDSVMVKVENAQDADDYISEGHFVDCSRGSELHLKNEEIEIKSENDEMSEGIGDSVPAGTSGMSDSLKMKGQISKVASEGEKHLSSGDHMARHSGLTKAFGCQKCTYKTHNKRNLTRHMVRHKDKSEVEVHKCENCEYETSHQGNMTRHMLTHRDPRVERKFKCDQCLYETDFKSSLRMHHLRHKDKSEVEMHRCENCEFETRYKGSMIVHMVKHRDPRAKRKFKCEHCPYETYFKRGLRVHNLRHMDKSEVEMQCENCEYKTRYKNHMIRHMLKHRRIKAERKFKCGKCPFQTDIESSVRRHYLIHKDKSEVEMHRCENCEFETRYKNNMIQHMLRHRNLSAERKFRCDKCPYQTDIKGNLWRHNAIHTDKSEVEVYKCENCKFESKYKSSMIKHMLKHRDHKAGRKF